MYKAIESLSDKKYVEDKFTFELDSLNSKYQEICGEKYIADQQIKTLLHERDKLRNDLKEIVKSRLLLIKDKEAFAKQTKERIAVLEADLLAKNNSLVAKQEEFAKLDKSFKMMTNERDKLKERLQRLKNKRLRVDVNQKLCKKCGKEFLESENYNWSCRTHTTEYRIMWWCCGKTNKDAPGCTVSKHESREDEDDAAADEKDDKFKNIR